ncbi:MAG: type I polyketide synthase [Lachnospiraceae bacterium]|nr:type I polyketide synthase [Lachnospiraceae bacterium]
MKKVVLNGKKYKEDSIAIVGIGCRFPGNSNDVHQFWDLLKNGKDAIVDVPKNRWDRHTFYHADRAFSGKTVSQKGGFIDGMDQFDPGFFGITPREATFIDPQQRILMEVSWEAMEDAGMITKKYVGSDTGVFIGAFTLDYQHVQFDLDHLDQIDLHSATGSMMTLVANRLSYVYDFVGPSLAIDTACSGSLVAIHTACQNIRNKECSMAIAGGILLNFAPQYTIAESRGGFLSPDGKCKTLDESANGYVRGEGAAVVVLKPLKDAIADKDQIYSVILGSAVNQDGQTNGITVPNGESQKVAIEKAVKQAGIKLTDVQYIEMHGTGTPVGDPIEANALGESYGKGRNKKEPCVIASVKTNIGHTESVAGVAGVIKTSLILKEKKIPPHLHLKTINPKIDLEALNLKVPLELMDYPKHKGMAVAAVNSFGFGGTNAHAILAEAPEIPLLSSTTDESLRIFPISARSETGLKAMAKRYYDFLEQKSIENIYDLGYSMAFRRDQHPFRLGVVAKNIEELKENLNDYIQDIQTLGVAQGRQNKEEDQELVFVFTGMGPQWWGMGQELMKTEPVFMEAIQKCDKEFLKYAGWSLLEAMSAEEETSEMSQTKLAQPANFAIQFGLIQLWESKGIQADVIVGHSAGEVAAFYCAGVLCFEDAVRVIYYRSSLQQRLTGKGKMMAVSMSKEAVEELIADYEGINIVAINSATGVTLAGEEEELVKLGEAATEQGVFSKFLDVTVPFHSHYMEEIKDEFMAGIADVTFHMPATTLYSTTIGKCVTEQMDASYLWNNVRHAVYFADAAMAILDAGYTKFLEVGPHPTLSYYLKEMCAEKNVNGTFISSLNRKQTESATFYFALAGLYATGVFKEWTRIYPEIGNFVKLPHYAWQREVYWSESSSSKIRRLGVYDRILLGKRLATARPTWEVELKKELIPFLDDHCIGGNPLFPAAGYMEMALQLANEYYGEGFYILEDIAFKKAVFIQPNKPTKLQMTLDEERATFTLYNVSNVDHYELVSTGALKQIQNFAAVKSIDLRGIKEKTLNNMRESTGEKIYKKFHGSGFQYTNTFAAIDKIWVGETEAISKVKMPQVEMPEKYEIYPGILDVCFQGIVALEFGMDDNDDTEIEMRLPVSVDKFLLYADLKEKMWSYCCQTKKTDIYTDCDIYLYDDNGHLIAEIKRLRVQVLEGVSQKVPLKIMDSWLYDLEWLEKENVEEIKEESQPGSWLILRDKSGVSAQYEKILTQQGETYFCVELGEALSIEMEAKKAMIGFNNDEDFVTLYQTVTETMPIKGIMHFWNIDLPKNHEITTQNVLQSGDAGVYTVLSAVKAAVAVEKAPKLWIVTKGAQAIDSQKEREVMQNAIWGTARLLANQEYIASWGGIVDLDPDAIADSLNQLATQVLKGDDEDQIAFRNGLRYVARVRNTSNLTKPLPVQMDEHASYMVTGAFGALGQLVANWLVEKGAKKLILLGRENLPEREAWQNEDLAHKIQARIKFVQGLEEKGATVIVDAIDFLDEHAVKAYFVEHAESLKSVRGVISAVGVVKDMLIAQMSKEVFDEVYQTKVFSHWVLHKCFEKQRLDFFVMFSSIAALITTAGQANYTAANAFLDGLATYRRQKGLAALSIAWGPWAVGMIKELNLINVYRQKGLEPITPDKGMQTLERLIHQNIPYSAVLEADWLTLKESNAKSKIPYLEEVMLNSLDGDDELRSDEEILKEFQSAYSSLSKEDRMQMLEEQVIQIVARALHMKQEEITMENSLTELGLDSMVATELRNKIELKLGASLNVIDLLNNQPLQEKVEKIADQLDTLLELNTMEDLIKDTSEEELDVLLAQLEDMSDEEMAEMLDSNLTS